MLRSIRRLVSALAVAACAAGTAMAADYPNKPIKLIVPYAPGGSSDVIMRPVAMALSRQLGQQVVIVNVGGGDGAVGWAQAAKAAPDGYTITMLTNAMIVREAINIATAGVADFAPVANVGFVDLTVTAKGDGGAYKTMKDYVGDAVKRPGLVTLAMGVGTPAQFVAAEVNNAVGGILKPVNVGGGAAKMTAVLGGHADALIEPISSTIGQHNGGQLRILAVLSDKRLAFAPDIPTAREQGIDVVSRLFYGLGAPKETPKDIVAKLADAVKALDGDTAFQEQLKAVSFSWDFSAGDAYKKIIDDTRANTKALAAKL
jgi:tripartite-type tricarboxylate transporter receptor subunit TctC